jgi:hypothetical protein
MPERRYRPGDVLDDYCPRERRITDHAIVAMIDDEIRRTRCGVCDTEHEYKAAKVPAPRRRTQPPALFNQVLEGINGPARPHPSAAVPEHAEEPSSASARENPHELRRNRLEEPFESPEAIAAQPAESAFSRENADELRRDKPVEPVEPGDRDGGFRRSLIRATFPRPDGQQPPARDIPEFTIHSLHHRRNGQRHAGGQHKFRGGRRRPGGGTLDHSGPMRFRDHGHGQTSGQGHGGGRRRRGGKKNR